MSVTTYSILSEKNNIFNWFDCISFQKGNEIYLPFLFLFWRCLQKFFMITIQGSVHFAMLLLFFFFVQRNRIFLAQEASMQISSSSEGNHWLVLFTLMPWAYEEFELWCLRLWSSEKKFCIYQFKLYKQSQYWDFYSNAMQLCMKKKNPYPSLPCHNHDYWRPRKTTGMHAFIHLISDRLYP